MLDRKTARRIAADLVADLQAPDPGARAAGREGARARAAIGDELTRLQAQIRRAAGGTIDVRAYRFDRMLVWLEAGHGLGPAIAIPRLDGSRQLTAYAGAKIVRRASPGTFRGTLELQEDQGPPAGCPRPRGPTSGRPGVEPVTL